jgi:hypothetical protein
MPRRYSGTLSSARYVLILPAENYTAFNSHSSVCCIVSTCRIRDLVLGYEPIFSPRYSSLRTFSGCRNLSLCVSDLVLGHEPIFGPRYRGLRTFLSTGRNLPA